MNMRWLMVALAAASAGLCAAASAQSPYQYSQPQLRDDEQISPSQILQPPPPRAASKPSATTAQPKPALAALPPATRATGPAHAVACSGAFAKSSGHLKLATLFGAQNVKYTEVSDDNGGTLMASVLYPDDPKRRLEVVWDDDAARSGTSLVVIDGQSTWIGPKGLRLGLALAALEKINGKPLKLKGFGKNDLAQVSDWNGGALATIPGDCRVGVELKPDPKASADARDALPSDKEFMSGDAAVKAVKPTVGEIVIGY